MKVQSGLTTSCPSPRVGALPWSSVLGVHHPLCLYSRIPVLTQTLHILGITVFLWAHLIPLMPNIFSLCLSLDSVQGDLGP